MVPALACRCCRPRPTRPRRPRAGAPTLGVLAGLVAWSDTGGGGRAGCLAFQGLFRRGPGAGGASQQRRFAGSPGLVGSPRPSRASAPAIQPLR